MSNRYAVIMAGGRGERFWPKSTRQKPKHLQAIVGDSSMLAQTVARLDGVLPVENILVITNAEQRPAVLEDCPQLAPENVIGEPMGRDTAAAVGLASVLVGRRNPQAVFAMLPADHVIHDKQGFCSTLESSFEAAEAEEVLVTVGIKPTEPATGYGYIQRDGGEGGDGVHVVRQFVEKPNLEKAQAYLESGEYYWNAGMFIWSVQAIDNAMSAHCQPVAGAFDDIRQRLAEGGEVDAVLAETYGDIQKISIDFAVMEGATNVRVIESRFDWDDVGAWPAIARHYPADEAGNVKVAQVSTLDASGNIVVDESSHLTALVGVEDLIVVRTEKATLICHKDRAQDVKALVRQISEKPDWEALT